MKLLYYCSINRQTQSVAQIERKKIWHVLSKLSVSLLVLNQVLNSCKHRIASLLSFLPSLSNSNTLVSSAYKFMFVFDTAVQISLTHKKQKWSTITYFCYIRAIISNVSAGMLEGKGWLLPARCSSAGSWQPLLNSGNLAVPVCH